MSRKGEATARSNERRYPHRVVVVVPPGGFGRQIEGIHAAIAALGVPLARGRGFRRADRDYVTWCFADAATADAAAAAIFEAGGEVVEGGDT